MLDVHTHFFPRGLPPPDDRAIGQGWPVVSEQGGRIEVRQRGELVRVLGSSARDPRSRVADMDRDGVATQVVMPTPFTFLHDADPDLGVRYARAQNEQLAELVGTDRERFRGLGALPLQDPAAAIEEARRSVTELGMAGVAIGTHTGTRQLHDPELEPVLAELERLGASVFVHPWRPVAPERTSHSGLGFGLARPVETELAVGSLVFGGVLERHPRLRICLAHGGAGIPALRGRLRNGWERQDPDRRRPRRDPLELMRTLWADSLTYDPAAYALAEDTFGVEHMVLGSDYPFAAQERPFAASVAAADARGIARIGPGWAARTADNGRAFLGEMPTTVADAAGSANREETTR
ncbi:MULTISPECIES: amidohydrolase family protein [unclassified Pseudonocardia]|uniref:amidohydrolase family protein n=1 Tax=unclassified Pseudonocardia TaxID=2619320 RepID=UPI000761D14D|nr:MULTISPECIES: amidohydrolase family protein [unclassified Pseudonocardia]